MTISIITCPQCNAMVLNDAVRCHVCDHSFAEESVAVVESTPALPTDQQIADDLHVCKHCGETYRTGLVRCWNCGNFTRDEIKAAYDEMVSSHGNKGPQRVQLPELAPQTTTRSGPWKFEVTAAPSADGQGTDIDAADSDFDFELADTVQLEDSRSVPRATGDTYAVATSLPDITDDASPPALAAPAEAEAAAPIPDVTKPAGESKKLPDAPEVSHSEATGGDALLNIAQEEEQDIQQSKKQFRSKSTIVVYCPMGCRVRVQERHRGRAGKCPKCGSTFFVPKATSKTKTNPEIPVFTGANPTDSNAAGKWRGWMDDVHVHTVVPQKLRIKADSLKNEFALVDLAFSDQGLVLLTLVKAAGFMGANLKKKPAIRQAAQEHLRTAGKVDGLAVGAQRLIPIESLSQLAMGQPSPPDVESMFGNIPVFGVGRIAIRLPKTADATQTDYLSFSLSEFRKFVESLESVTGVAGLGKNTEVPLTDTYNTLKCHYSDVPVKELLGLEYYQQDPGFKLQISGWRCGGCSLVVSEDARKKEKIGGLNGKAIAKAKCPKCPAKFGNHPLYEVSVVEPAKADNPSAEPAAAKQ
jgi:hypothetical protein